MSESSALQSSIPAVNRTWRNVTALWMVPVAAVLIGVHWAFPEGPRTAAGEAQHFSSAGIVFIQEFVFFEGGLIVLLFGVIALGDYLKKNGSRGWGRAAGLLSAVAVAMFVPAVGIPAQALPGLSDVYLSGHPQVGTVFDAFNSGRYGASFPIQFAVVTAVSVAGAISVGVAGWRSRAIPRWCCVVFPIGFLLNATDTPVIAWIGLALMALSGSAIAYTAQRKAPVASIP